MKAAFYESFQGPITIKNLPDPQPAENGVVIEVKANGICMSDWHGWMGHDPDITLPHVPGHELSGIITETGSNVNIWKKGDRVTLPFVCGCGTCVQCRTGNHQVCDHQFQPGFTHWGSFAEYVAIDYADINLVALPETIDFITAASLGCRFATSFRAVTAQGKVSAGQWVAVHGCGGVGLSAIMIATALGANVIGIDITDDKLAFAESVGAVKTINARATADIPEAVKEMTRGGAHVSIDALGSQVTCFNSIACLKKRGKHVQVGLMTGDHMHPVIPMNQVIANELEICGSHGMQAFAYENMLQMIISGKLKPQQLISGTVTLEDSIEKLITMDQFTGKGVTVIDRF